MRNIAGLSFKVSIRHASGNCIDSLVSEKKTRSNLSKLESLSQKRLLSENPPASQRSGSEGDKNLCDKLEEPFLTFVDILLGDERQIVGCYT